MLLLTIGKIISCCYLENHFGSRVIPRIPAQPQVIVNLRPNSDFLTMLKVKSEVNMLGPLDVPMDR